MLWGYDQLVFCEFVLAVDGWLAAGHLRQQSKKEKRAMWSKRGRILGELVFVVVTKDKDKMERRALSGQGRRILTEIRICRKREVDNIHPLNCQPGFSLGRQKMGSRRGG